MTKLNNNENENDTMTEIESARQTVVSLVIDACNELLEYEHAAGARVAMPGTDKLILIGTSEWIAENVPPVAALIGTNGGDKLRGYLDRRAEVAEQAGVLTDDEIVEIMTLTNALTPIPKHCLRKAGRAIEREVTARLATPAPVTAAQAEPAGHVVDIDRNCNESIIDVALEPGTPIYLAAPAAAQAVRVPEGFVWPEPPPSKGQSQVLFEDGYAEGWAKAIDTVRTQLAAAPAPAAPTAKEAGQVDIEGIRRIADELEQEAQAYSGDFADTVTGCADALRHLTTTATPAQAAVEEVREQTPIECWSRDEEDFNAKSLGELLDSHDDLEVGATVWVGEAVHPDPAQLVQASWIIENMGEVAYDIAGEHAEDYPEVTDVQVSELEDLVADWIKRTCPPTFYTVKNVKPYVLTADDIGRAGDTKGEPA